MTHYCYNYISITGPTNTIKELWDTIQSFTSDGNGVGLLQAMIPIPREIDPRDKGIYWTYNGPSLPLWKSINWGVKSDVDDIGALSFSDHEHEPTELSGWFYTNNNPPIQAYKGFLTKHPECSISAWYHEPWFGVAGRYVNGQHDWYDEQEDWEDWQDWENEDWENEDWENEDWENEDWENKDWENENWEDEVSQQYDPFDVYAYLYPCDEDAVIETEGICPDSIQLMA